MAYVLDGVHFRSDKIDFGAAPNRYARGGFDEHDRHIPYRPGTKYLYDENDGGSPGYEAGEIRTKRRATLLAKAAALEGNGDYARAITIYREMNRSGLGEPSYIRRRVEVLSWAMAGVSHTGLHEYLSATRNIVSNGKLPDEAKVDDFLKPYVSYQKAVDHEVASAYRKCANDYPTSQVAESALIMAARCALTGQVANTFPNADAQKIGGADLDILLHRYPHSRFKPDALGLKARIACAQEDYAGAAKLYELQSSMENRKESKSKLLWSLVFCYTKLNRKDRLAATWLRDVTVGDEAATALQAKSQFVKVLSEMNAGEASKFAQLLKDDIELTRAYLLVRIELTDTTKAERRDISRIALASLKSHPGSPVRTNLYARLAQMSYDDNNRDAALRLASKALSISKKHDDDWALGQYVLAATMNRTGNSQKAISGYERLIRAAPTSYLADGAKEALAYLYDQQGRLDRSLSLCYDLDCEPDVAYLLDAKMSPSQIEAYIRAHPHDKNRSVWTYSLGLRYLRKDDYRKAIKVFASMKPQTRKKMSHDGDGGYIDSEEPRQDPLQTAKDLLQLTYEAKQARGSDARAAARYRVASYFYTRRNLLLYNAPLWQGGRTFDIGYSWNATTASNLDDQVLREHHYEHECLMHAYKICLEILKAYPNSPTAPRAAYRGACAADRLARINPWWRWEGERIDLEGQASRLMKQVATQYPKSDLAANALKYAKTFLADNEEHHNQQLWKEAHRKFSPEIY